jgi:D-alanyl-D-alanine carboxypeptidase
MIGTDPRGGRRCFLVVAAFLLAAFITVSASSCGTPSFSKSVQDKITATVEKTLKAEGIPGAIVGVWQNGEGQYVKAFGKAALAPSLAMQSDFVWKIASITKTFTANVVLQLAGQGKIGLEDKLSRYSWSEGIANRDQITVRMLLNHTSGLPDLENDTPAFQKVRFGDPTKVWTQAEILRWTRTLEPLSAPGTAYHYSNTGYYLLGLMIEGTTGKTAAQEIQALCADKLGLKNTRLADMPAYLLSLPHSDGYVAKSGLPPEIDVPGKTDNINATRWNTTAGWTSAGVDSGVYDLKTWIEAVASGKLLTPAMKTVQLENPVQMSDNVNGPHYGLGVAITKLPSGDLFWHNGATLGYSSYAGTIPRSGITIVVFTNKMPPASGDSVVSTALVAPILTAVQEPAAK